MVLILIGNGLSYRTSAKRLGMSKNTVTGIVKRHHCPEPAASA
jgi:transposase